MLDPLHPFDGQSFVPLAKELFARLDQGERCDFQDLRAEPESSAKSLDRGLEHFLGAAPHARIKRLLPRRAKARFATQKALRFAIQDLFMTSHRLTEPVARHLHREKAMSLSRVPVRAQTFLVRRIVSDSLRIDDGRLRRAFVNGAATLEIDANLEAVWMKTARPVKRAPALEVVPFHAYAFLRKAAKKRTPFALDPSPHWFLTEIIPFLHSQPILRFRLNNKQKCDEISIGVGCCGELARFSNGCILGAMETIAPANYKIGNEKLIRVLDAASAKLRALLERQGRADGALRVSVIGGGCSGLQYKMDLVDGPANRDILVQSNNVRVVVDPKSALFVSGSELDFSDDLQKGGFKVSNPNAVAHCSCGESFSA